jgi:hypothetical protein
MSVKILYTQEQMYQHHHHHHHHHHQMSCKARAERLHQLHWNEPWKVAHLEGLMENWKTINSCVSLLQRKTRHLHEDVECVYGKISRKKWDLFARIVVFLSIHTISYTETLLKVCSKFHIFISYSFLVIYFFIRGRTSCLTSKKSLTI